MSEPRPIDHTTGRRRTGRPTTITRDGIAAAALATIDGITIGRVAKELGVGASSLYHHVDGRAELILLAADAALADVDWPRLSPGREPSGGEPSGWRVYLRELADLLADTLRARPGLALALQALAYPPPRLQGAMADAGRALASVGFTERDASLALAMIGRLAVDATLYDEAEPLPERLRADGANYALVGGSSRGNLHAKLDVILDGFAARLIDGP